MKNFDNVKKEKQKQIAIWIMEHGFAEGDGPNTMTREELMKMFTESWKEQLRVKLLKKYLETFGENYEGDIIEDVFLDLKERQALEKIADS